MKSKTFLLILAACAVVILGVVGYVLSTGKYQDVANYKNEIRNIQSQSSSDETESIEKDLNETSFDDLDKELLEIEAELSR